jgi:type II secretory pathway pseudopilin PulG
MNFLGRIPNPLLSGPARGFSLIEVVLAIGIVSFSLIAILGLLPMALNGERQSQDETHMAHIASQIFADLQARGTFEIAPNTAPIKVLPYASGNPSSTPTPAYYSTDEELLLPGSAAAAYIVTLTLVPPASTGNSVAMPVGPSLALAVLSVKHNIQTTGTAGTALETQTFQQLIGSYP